MNKLSNRILLSVFIISVIFSFLYTSSQISIINQENIKRESGAKIALNFISRMRSYPNNDIPKARFMEEYKKNKTKLRKTSASIQESEPWKAMGPLNVPGRMISLAVNPQNSKTLYTGAATGGL